MVTSTQLVLNHDVTVIRKEWSDVYQKIYSNDTALQSEAYNRMCVWKLRCPKLPLGVECTMEILQIFLFDKKCNEKSVYSKKDVQLMYSTTLMRFVNLVTHLLNNKLNKSYTCYEIARMYDIPDWIVNVRHEAAHKNILPSIELLQAAANNAFDWLHNNYWVLEEKDAFDLVLEVSSTLASVTEQKIKLLLNLWQSCKLYKFTNCHSVGDIPNVCLRSHLFSLTRDRNILNDCEVDPEIPVSFAFETYLINDRVTEKGSIRITAVLKFLNKYLKKLIPVDSKNDNIKSIFIKSLIQCELFLPVTFNHELYSHGSRISRSLSYLWRDVLEVYHESCLITNLLSELAEISVADDIRSRQLVAACWILHITESLCNPSDEIVIYQNVIENRKFAFAFLKRNEDGQNTNDVEMIEAVPSSPNLNLSKNILLNYQVLENIVNKVIMNPNQYTMIYLPSLLNLLDPPLELSAKNRILELVETFTDTKGCEPSTDIIYTPDMLPGSNTFISGDQMSEEEHEEEIHLNKSIWSKKHGVYDWGSCPLGRLPSSSENECL